MATISSCFGIACKEPRGSVRDARSESSPRGLNHACMNLSDVCEKWYDIAYSFLLNICKDPRGSIRDVRSESL